MDENSPQIASAAAELGSAASVAAAGLTPAVAAPKSSQFRWYMFGYAAFFVAMGLNQVLIQNLIVLELHELGSRYSLAQTAMMLPMLVLVMFGGAAADRAELRGHLVRLQIVMAIPPAVLAFVVGFDMLTYVAMVLYGVSIASVQAFIQPARDSFLTNVAERTPGLEIPRAVAAATAVQFMGQLGGFALASTAGTVGNSALLATLSGLLLVASLVTLKLAPAERHNAQTRKRENIFKQFEGGFREVLHSERLRPIVICMFLMGIFGMGGMMVIIPILLRDVYRATVFELSAFQFFFMGGTFTTALILSYRRPVRRQGRALVICMLGSISAMTAMHFGLPLYIIFPLVSVWGLCGGMWMSMSRAILQESAPPTHRARILAVFSMGMLGGAPIGAIVAGQLVHYFGPQNAILFPPTGMFLIMLGMIFFTRLWYLERPQPTR